MSLESLPIDILFNIFSQLICPLVAQNIARAPQNHKELLATDLYRLENPNGFPSYSNHPYLCLAAQCRTLRLAIEDYCHHLMLKRLTIKAARILKPIWSDWSKDVADASAKGKTSEAKHLRTYRLQYLKWSVESCLFCGKTSKRRAIFNMQMWCCKKCDDLQFGKKISKSEASKKYKVQEVHWKYPYLLWPKSWSAALEFSFANLPVYQGAMMFKEDDIARLSEDLKAAPPSRARMQELKGLESTRQQFLRKFQDLTLRERGIIQIIGKTIDRLRSGELKLPADQKTLRQLRTDHLECTRIARDVLPSAGAAAQWLYVQRWWEYLLPSEMKDSFEHSAVIADTRLRKHNLLVRTESLIDMPHGGSQDKEGRYWNVLTYVTEWLHVPFVPALVDLTKDLE